MDIDKIIVSNKVSFGKKGFKCFIGYKDGKKWMLIEEILIKLNKVFFNKKMIHC